MTAAPSSAKWETLNDEQNRRVRRFPVPFGWLYQVESVLTQKSADGEFDAETRCWSAPVFVPEVRQ